MGMKRILVREALEDTGVVTLGAEEARYLGNVLRLAPADEVMLVDGQGRAWKARIVSFDDRGRKVSLEYSPLVQEADHPVPEVTVLLSLIKATRMDQAIRQLTEIGVARIVPVIAERSVPDVPGERRNARIDRWRKISREALRQSRRPHLPSIEPIVDLSHALKTWKSKGLSLAAWEGEKLQSMKDVLLGHEGPREATLLVGPEGGLTEREADAAKAEGFRLVSLGPTILRTETAAVALAAITLSLL